MRVENMERVMVERANAEKKAWNDALEAAAKLVETDDSGINNVGMLHPINRRQAAAIRALKKG